MLTPANYSYAYKKPRIREISLLFVYFCECFAPDDDFTEHLQMFWPHFASIWVQFLFFSEIYSCWTHFCWSFEVWSQFSMHPLSASVPASYQPFPVVWIKHLCGLHNGAICWSRPNMDSRPFTPVLEQTHFIWGHRLYLVCDVCEMLSLHLIHPGTEASAPGPRLLYFTNSELLPVTLAHLLFSETEKLTSYVISQTNR